ncbi:MAG TPA: hypothetical protein DCG12_20315 [Planctomycetaceae bacterium]|nr:hypothetical protein [Planctomycetaceae bacterium]
MTPGAKTVVKLLLAGLCVASLADEAGATADEADGVISSVKTSFPADPLPDFEFTDVTGGTLSLKDLKGKRWVASFVFSRCTQTCPQITQAVHDVHRRVKESAPDVLFVSITVDPKYDTVEQLGAWSNIFTKGDYSRWKWLTGSQKEIYELIVGGFALYVRENPPASRLPGLEVAHANRVVLVNEDGIPVASFLGTKPGDMNHLRQILDGTKEFPKPGPRRGAGPGFSITSADGSTVPIQIVPVQDNGAEKDGDSKGEDAGDRGEGDPEKGASAGAEHERDVIAVEQKQSVEEPLSEQVPDATEGEMSPAKHNRLIDQKLPAWARALPTLNAVLNSLAAICLVTGLMAIRSQNRDRHRNLMITAFVISVLFLLSYMTSHYAMYKYAEVRGRRFTGQGVWWGLYQLILWPHIALAAAVPVLAIRVFQHAFAQRWDAHRKLAKVTFPIWMYVSVTGVVIYLMLNHWPGA